MLQSQRQIHLDMKSVFVYKAQKGFTLVEVLLALFIFSLIATSTVYALRVGINARGQLEQSDDRLRKLQLTRLLIKDDLAQYVERDVRGVNATRPIGSFTSGIPEYIIDDNGDRDNGVNNNARNNSILNEQNLTEQARSEQGQALFHITRAGWANPDYQSPRSTIQSVYYIVKGNSLIRRSYPLLDDIENQPVIDRLLMTDIQSASARFLLSFQNGEPLWVDEWANLNDNFVRPDGSFINNAFGAPPIAIEMAIEDRYFGTIRQLFWVGPYSVNNFSSFDDDDNIDDDNIDDEIDNEDIDIEGDETLSLDDGGQE